MLHILFPYLQVGTERTKTWKAAGVKWINPNQIAKVKYPKSCVNGDNGVNRPLKAYFYQIP